MSRNKQNKNVRVATVSINGSVATADYTTDAQRLEDLPWSVNVWFDSAFAVTGDQPTIQIQVSDDPNNEYSSVDTDSFNDLELGFNTAPRMFKSRGFEYRWIRFIYLSEGATAGVININLVQ